MNEVKMFNKVIWRSISFSALLLTIIFVIGIFFAYKDVVYPEKSLSFITKPLPEEKVSEGFTCLAFGDSLTRGTGDITGNSGYVGVLKNKLPAILKTTPVIQNYGIVGATSFDLKTLIAKRTTLTQIKRADLIIITIGGNDLFHGGESLEKLDLTMIEKARVNYQQNLENIITTIRKANKEVPIYILGLYNPFIDLPKQELTSKVVQTWNQTIIDTITFDPKITFIPTFDLFQNVSGSPLLYTDHFHPNTQGYEKIAERILAIIEVNYLDVKK